MLSQKKNTAEDAGQQTLELFEDKDLFNQWLFERLTLFCKDNVLEIGSGIGNISKLLLRRYGHVSLSDVEEKYIEILKTKFSAHSSLRSVQRLDISDVSTASLHLTWWNMCRMTSGPSRIVIIC